MARTVAPLATAAGTTTAARSRVNNVPRMLNSPSLAQYHSRTVPQPPVQLRFLLRVHRLYRLLLHRPIRHLSLVLLHRHCPHSLQVCPLDSPPDIPPDSRPYNRRYSRPNSPRVSLHYSPLNNLRHTRLHSRLINPHSSRPNSHRDSPLCSLRNNLRDSLHVNPARSRLGSHQQTRQASRRDRHLLSHRLNRLAHQRLFPQHSHSLPLPASHRRLHQAARRTNRPVYPRIDRRANPLPTPLFSRQYVRHPHPRQHPNFYCPFL